MTEVPDRRRRWVTCAGLLLLAATAFGGRLDGLEVCQVCRARAETTTWGLTLGDSIGVPVCRTRRETSNDVVLAFLGGSHEHGAAMVRTRQHGYGFLMSQRTWCGGRASAVEWIGLSALIAGSPELAAAFRRRIEAGEITATEMRDALEVPVFDPEEYGAPALTASQRALLRRMATILGEEMNRPARAFDLDADGEIWSDADR